MAKSQLQKLEKLIENIIKEELSDSQQDTVDRILKLHFNGKKIEELDSSELKKLQDLIKKSPKFTGKDKLKEIDHNDNLMGRYKGVHYEMTDSPHGTIVILNGKIKVPYKPESSGEQNHIKIQRLIQKMLDNKELSEKLVVSSPDGTERTLTSNQKMTVKKAADAGDDVEIKKKGDNLQEENSTNGFSAERKGNKLILTFPKSKSSYRMLYTMFNDERVTDDPPISILGKGKSNEYVLILRDGSSELEEFQRILARIEGHDEVSSDLISDIQDAVYDFSKRDKKKDAEHDRYEKIKQDHRNNPGKYKYKTNESQDMEESEKSEMFESDAIKSSLDEILEKIKGMHEGKDDVKMQRYCEGVAKHLNRAISALEALRGHENILEERRKAEEEKANSKHVKAVQKLLTKKVKDKKDVEPLIKKYGPVAVKLKQKGIEDPAKAADMVWKHVLKEAKETAKKK